MDTEKYVRLVQAHRSEILAAEQYIWNTSAYLEQIFENAGYTLTKAGNIPGFYTDIDTGRPGPKLLILCELDALYVPNHFAAVDGCAHACGHHAQCAAMVGLALALKASGALDGLSGSIRLMAVPAEECIQTEFRAGLRQQGVIRYLGGKDEFMYRGYFDGVNLAFMFHTGGSGKSLFDVHAGCNGSIIKQARYEGVATHAASTPELGVNALYAASLGLQAINSLRETFRDQDHVRVHPIMTDGGDSVSVIPSSSALAMMVRGGSLSSIRQTSVKVDRALAAGALALGARLHVTDYPGYAPLHNAPMMVDFAVEVMSQLVGSGRTLRFHRYGKCQLRYAGSSSVHWRRGRQKPWRRLPHRKSGKRLPCLCRGAARAGGAASGKRRCGSRGCDRLLSCPLRFHPGLPRRLGPLREIGRPDLLRRWAGNGVFRVKRSALRAKQ